jgi:Tfp pilus assembly protein FimT
MRTEVHLDVCDGKADADSFVVPDRASLVRKTVIARSEAIHRPRRHCERQRSNPCRVKKEWIASRSLSSGAHSRDPLARNDV